MFCSIESFPERCFMNGKHYDFTDSEFQKCANCPSVQHISDLRPDPVYPTELVCEKCYASILEDVKTDRGEEVIKYAP